MEEQRLSEKGWRQKNWKKGFGQRVRRKDNQRKGFGADRRKKGEGKS